MNASDSPTVPRNNYTEDDMLPLSGIQHYMFCPRQWALIHLEQQWSDNYLTAEGKLLHKRVDNPMIRQTNGTNVVTLRGIRIESARLGLSGIADALELHPFDGAPTEKRKLLKSKMYTALPVEYKRGHTKTNDCDRVQVGAQAMILEEMLGVAINRAAIFYWEERHREYIDIDNSLRSKILHLSDQMHAMLKSGESPAPIKTKSCKSCSLANTCMPSTENKSASKYLKSYLDEEIT